MGIEEQQFIVYVAAYLYSLTNDREDKDKEWHMQFFISIYNKYADSKHEGDCIQQPFSCWRCFVEKYIELANNIVNIEPFKLYLEELKE